ncbi:MAG: aminopeptidase P family protein [Desulfovibrionales bacterium]|nr:MAG: aminopeptidase P family protein [Desulfovibrionales bacterium]
MPEIHAQRREKLRARLESSGLSALLVSSPANRFYLSGFELHDPQCNESAGMLVIAANGEDWLLTDPRFEITAQKVWPEERLFIYRSPKMQQIRDFLGDLGHRPLGFEARAVSVELYSDLAEQVTLKPTRSMVEALRLVKDAQEIALLEASCRLNHEIFALVPELLRPGRTEREIAWDMEKLFRERGSEELAFPTIVGVDANAAQPHAVPNHTPVRENCLVLVDAGARLNQYCSDQTRTFWVGEHPPDIFQRTMDLVREAQDRAIAAIRPGLPVHQAYQLVQDFFRDHLVEKRFTHGLGHGIGLETHEGPSLSPNDKTILAPGMVVTVEPGLYSPDWGGIRWEYMVLVTEDGCRIL